MSKFLLVAIIVTLSLTVFSGLVVGGILIYRQILCGQAFAHFDRAEMLYQQQKFTEAVPYYRQAAETWPTPEIRARLVMALYHAGAKYDARSESAVLVQEHPEECWSWLARGVSLIGEGMRSTDSLSAAIRRDPDDRQKALIYFYSGVNVLTTWGHAARHEAEKDLRELRKIVPPDSSMSYDLECIIQSSWHPDLLRRSIDRARY